MDLKLNPLAGGGYDISPDGAADETAQTPTIMALSTDARANGERGYWGDPLLGSKLWLLTRERLTAETIQAAKEYCENALAPLVEEGILKGIKVEVTRSGASSLDIMIEGKPYALEVKR